MKMISKIQSEKEESHYFTMYVNIQTISYISAMTKYKYN